MAQAHREGLKFTVPEKIWPGNTVICFASGPSLLNLDLEQWHEIRQAQRLGVILFSVNSSIKTIRKLGGLEPDAILFTDSNWWDDNKGLIRNFSGRKFTMSRRAKAECPELDRIETIGRVDFPIGHGPIKDGRSSGHRAVSLAVTLGAKRIVLLGYDMQVDKISGRSHCHDDYQNTERPQIYQEEFIPSFLGWNEAAIKIGCEIVNCTYPSALIEFPFGTLKDCLKIESLRLENV